MLKFRWSKYESGAASIAFRSTVNASSYRFSFVRLTAELLSLAASVGTSFSIASVAATGAIDSFSGAVLATFVSTASAFTGGASSFEFGPAGSIVAVIASVVV